MCPARNRCQKALSDFLEEKRSAMPRFYFIGDEDLLEILGQASEGKSLVQACPFPAGSAAADAVVVVVVIVVDFVLHEAVDFFFWFLHTYIAHQTVACPGSQAEEEKSRPRGKLREGKK